MSEEHSGFELRRIAEVDRIRRETEERRRARTLRRHGNKGTRSWGYRVPGKGKRR